MRLRVHTLVACLVMAAGAPLTLTVEAAQKAAAKATAAKVTKPASQATPASATKKKAYSAETAKQRRTRLARARAAARARELREVQTPRFRVDEFGREVPDVRAEAAIIYNPQTNE